MVKFKVTNQFWDTATKKMIKADTVLEVSETVAENLTKQNLGYITKDEKVIILSEPEPEILSEPIVPKKRNNRNKK